MQFQTLKMAANSKGQGRLRSNSRTIKVLLTPSNVPTMFRWNNQNRFREKCKMQFQRLKWPPFTKVKVAEAILIFADKVPLTPSSFPTKFRWNNQNTFGEMCKNAISDTKNGCHFPKSWLFEVKFAEKVPLTPSNVPTNFC